MVSEVIFWHCGNPRLRWHRSRRLGLWGRWRNWRFSAGVKLVDCIGKQHIQSRCSAQGMEQREWWTELCIKAAWWCTDDLRNGINKSGNICIEELIYIMEEELFQKLNNMLASGIIYVDNCAEEKMHTEECWTKLNSNENSEWNMNTWIIPVIDATPNAAVLNCFKGRCTLTDGVLVTEFQSEHLLLWPPVANFGEAETSACADQYFSDLHLNNGR